MSEVELRAAANALIAAWDEFGYDADVLASYVDRLRWAAGHTYMTELVVVQTKDGKEVWRGPRRAARTVIAGLERTTGAWGPFSVHPL